MTKAKEKAMGMGMEIMKKLWTTTLIVTRVNRIMKSVNTTKLAVKTATRITVRPSTSSSRWLNRKMRYLDRSLVTVTQKPKHLATRSHSIPKAVVSSKNSRKRNKIHCQTNRMVMSICRQRILRLKPQWRRSLCRS